MGRMSKEQYKRDMEYVNSGGDKSYRVPPDIFETPWKYLSKGDKIAVCFWKGIFYSIIVPSLLGFCTLIGTCAYSKIKQHIKESKPQPKTSISRIYDSKIKNSLEGLVLSPWGNYHANGWLVTPNNIAYLNNPKSKYKTIFSLNNLPMSFRTMIDKASIRNRGKDITIYLRGRENEVIETADGGKTWEYITSRRMRSRHGFQPIKLKFLTQDKGRTWEIMKQ